ncbi:MAG TPA: radical SAM family heme chaperone HemW [Terriglobales bacterium]|nr:radical SAM family heme chaperone HemW [Terriglobales bacterium]
MPLGIYISIPFCKTKCSYCNFASGVFSKQVFRRYVDRIVADISASERLAAQVGGEWEREADSIYLGGGTPTLLEPEQLKRIFEAVRNTFTVEPNAEVTVECAPGTLTHEVIETLLDCGVNRVSLGVQSFIDKEASSVARLHTRQVTLEEIERLRSAGITNISIDLIAGLPHQTRESWEQSLSQTIGTGVPHASVYMLEVDEDSRLGRELIAGGTRYHAHHVPDDDLTADLYERAVESLNGAGVCQYEISNFARDVWQSKHNLKYWTRQPYFGFGVDAHSMLPAPTGTGLDAVRFATSDNLEQYVSGATVETTPISLDAAIEEAFFLGMRTVRGVELEELAERYGTAANIAFREELAEMAEVGLIEVEDGYVRLTARGRLVSNEVFSRLIGTSVQK